MHSSLKVLLAAAVLTGTAYTVNMANAGQTITGEGGLPLNPTATGIAPGSYEIGASYYDFGKDKGNTSNNKNNGSSPPPIIIGPPLLAGAPVNAQLLPNDNSPLNTYKLHFYGIHGAARVTKNIEVSGGIDRLRVTGDGEFNELTKTGIAIGGKYLINPDAEGDSIRYAVGAGYSRALLHNIRAYGVASKPFRTGGDRSPIMAHLGVRWDRYDLRDIDGDDSSRFSVFAGAEVPIDKKGQFSVIGEIASKNNDYDTAKVPFSLGLQFEPSKNKFKVSAGYQRQGLTDDAGLYANFGYAFN